MVYDSSTYMMGVILTAAIVAVVASVSIADLRRKGTNHCSVIASLILAGAFLMVIVCLPATSVQSRWTIFPSTAAIIELMLVLTSAILAGIGMVQIVQSQRYRRGRKRAVFTIIGDLVFGAFLIHQLQQYQTDSTTVATERRRVREPEQQLVISPGAPTVVEGDLKAKAKSTPPPSVSPGAHSDSE